MRRDEMDDRIYPLTWVTVREGVVTQHERPPSVSSNWEEAFGEGYVPAARIAELETTVTGLRAQTTRFMQAEARADRLSAMLKEAVEAVRRVLTEGAPRKVAVPYALDGSPHKADKCPHDAYTWESCDGCTDEFLAALLARLEARKEVSP
jgi:hypothetical protein